MTDYILHPEATPDKSFEELLNLVSKTGATGMALTKNNSVTHLIGLVNRKALYVVFLDAGHAEQIIPDNLLKLSPELFSNLMTTSRIDSRRLREPMASIELSGFEFSAEKDQELLKKLLTILFKNQNSELQPFIKSQSGKAQIQRPFSFGARSLETEKIPLEKTLWFYDRFGRFPISEKETELLFKERPFDVLEGDQEKAVHVFKEKLLAVPRGTVKLPGGYEIVVPENIVDLKYIKMKNLTFKNGNNVCEPFTYSSFNFFWSLPIKTASDYLSAMERIVKRENLKSLAGDFVSMITLAEGKALTSKELNVLTSLVLKYDIASIKEDPLNKGLLLVDKNNKRFGYQKGILNFMLTTGRFPKPSEAVKVKKMSEQSSERDLR